MSSSAEDSWSYASMAGVTGPTQEAVDAQPTRPVPELRAGRFGPFEILGSLGAGGAGSVYRARDPSSRRVLALKVPRGVISDRRRERFRREGQLTAQLEHPGIVRIFSAGEIEGVPYLAYELVEGESFDEALPRLDRRTRMKVILEVARAMAHAHEREVIHRDLKPANVLLDEHDGARVADFGLAMARGLSRMTQSNAMLGTPSHMAPEQFNHSRENVGPPTDVWALGTMLYKALTDRDPFPASNLAELAGLILTNDPKAPRSIDRSIPRAVEEVCLQALCKHPDDRQSDAGVFAAELEEALAAPASPRWPRRVVAAALIISGCVAFAAAPRSLSEREEAGEPVSAKQAKPKPVAVETKPASDGERAAPTSPRRPEEEPVDKAWLAKILIRPPLTKPEHDKLVRGFELVGRDYYVLGRRIDPIRAGASPLKGYERDLRLAIAAYCMNDDDRGWAKLGEYLVQGLVGNDPSGDEARPTSRALAMVGARLLHETAVRGDLSSRRMLGQLYMRRLYLPRDSNGFVNGKNRLLHDVRRGAGWYLLGLEPNRRTNEMRTFGGDAAFPHTEDEAWEWVGGRPN